MQTKKPRVTFEGSGWEENVQREYIEKGTTCKSYLSNIFTSMTKGYNHSPSKSHYTYSITLKHKTDLQHHHIKIIQNSYDVEKRWFKVPCKPNKKIHIFYVLWFQRSRTLMGRNPSQTRSGFDFQTALRHCRRKIIIKTYEVEMIRFKILGKDNRSIYIFHVLSFPKFRTFLGRKKQNSSETKTYSSKTVFDKACMSQKPI